MRYAAMPLLLAGLLAAAVPAREKKEPPPPGPMTEEEKTLLDLVNKERDKEKLPALKSDDRLRKAARGHSENMAKQGKLEHVLDGKRPGDRVDAVGYDFSRLGENIAFNDGGTPEEVVKGWMESKAHRDNILKKEFKETGVAVATDAKGVKYITQVFAAPR